MEVEHHNEINIPSFNLNIVNIPNIYLFFLQNTSSISSNPEIAGVAIILELEIQPPFFNKNTLPNNSIMMLLFAPIYNDHAIPSTGKATRHALPKSVSMPQLNNDNILGNGFTRSEWLEFVNLNKRTVSSSNTPITPALSGFVTPFPELIARATEGLKNYEPELCDDGVNGTYFLKDKNGKMIAVFKPQDEEGSSPHNPKNHHDGGNSIPSKAIKSGEAALREVAAYLLDREGFIGVPRTDLVRIKTDFSDGRETKIGSLQEFVDNEGSSEDFGPSAFPVREVHKIGILDIQMLNIDRHAGNILIKKNPNSKSFTLVPIDQGFSLPDNLECPWFEWMSWPQAKIRFDDETKSYISRIDIEKDIRTLRKLGIRNECIKTMKITTSLLKKAVAKNMTLYQIGSMLCRDNIKIDDPSEIEVLCKQAEQLAEKRVRGKEIGTEEQERVFFNSLDLVLDEALANKRF